jgi:hypothetical protein
MLIPGNKAAVLATVAVVEVLVVVTARDVLPMDVPKQRQK